MARIDICEDNLIVTIEGWHKLLALKHKIEVPLANVRGVRLRPEIPKFVDGDFRGTHVPGKVVAGYVMRSGANPNPTEDERTREGERLQPAVSYDDGVAFVDVEDPSRAIAIDLIEGGLKHIIIELSNTSPEDAAAHIEAARRARPVDERRPSEQHL